ncbi:hypothetical protein CSAL01_12315 [Colletotrichum salicis]|uniref:Uncharacterized protein n=1 Tax=Colletotrichum salicis TaxID=1209931 RepID=A0A135V0S5_9PEZI|nr:hypothetical protein CSAL01_12315 [Colletotrichum salicis]
MTEMMQCSLALAPYMGTSPGAFSSKLDARTKLNRLQKTKARGGEGKGRRWMAGLWMDEHLAPSSLKHQEQNQGKARQGPTTQHRLRRQQERSKRRAPLAGWLAGVGAGDGQHTLGCARYGHGCRVLVTRW